MTEDQFGDFFATCGEISNVRMVYNNQSNHFKGFGYVDFESSDSVKKALELSGERLSGRRIFVDVDGGRPRFGFKLNMNKEGNEKYNGQQRQIRKKAIQKQKKKDRLVSAGIGKL